MSGTAHLLAKSLYPIEPDRFGLCIALEDVAHRTERLGIASEFHQIGKSPQVEKSAEIPIYRIVQECILRCTTNSEFSGGRKT